MNSVSQLFWSEYFWLPERNTWKDFENVPGSNNYLPESSDVLWSIPLGILFLGIRYVYEQYMMTPLGYWLGIKKKKSLSFTPNPVLESYYQKNGIAFNNNLEPIVKQTDMTVREVERWLRSRKSKGLTSDIIKFRECAWHFIFYSGAFMYGLIVLWDKPWFWETKYCWIGWPQLGIPTEIYWYYMVELAFYWSLVFSIMSDHKRKDFNQLMIHHVATIILLSFSYVTNHLRIGTLVLIAHDVADIPLSLGKMLKYSGYKKVCEILLGVFIVVWILSRLIYYPFVVLYATSFEVYIHLGSSPCYHLFNGLLIVLQLLHILWSYMIARIVMQKIFKNKLEDIRSDSESDPESDSD